MKNNGAIAVLLVFGLYSIMGIIISLPKIIILWIFK
jgi:hypothetical protein